MSGKLSKTELTGLILLVLLIVAITGSAVMLKNCDGTGQPGVPEEPMVEVADSTIQQSTTSTKTVRTAKSRKKSGKRSGGRKASDNYEERDPFSDTIPLSD